MFTGGILTSKHLNYLKIALRGDGYAIELFKLSECWFVMKFFIEIGDLDLFLDSLSRLYFSIRSSFIKGEATGLTFLASGTGSSSANFF